MRENKLILGKSKIWKQLTIAVKSKQLTSNALGMRGLTASDDSASSGISSTLDLAVIIEIKSGLER